VPIMASLVTVTTPALPADPPAPAPTFESESLFSEAAAPLELHHHDVVHFALEEVMKELDDGQEEALMARLRAHLQSNVKNKPPKN